MTGVAANVVPKKPMGRQPEYFVPFQHAILPIGEKNLTYSLLLGLPFTALEVKTVGKNSEEES